MTALLVSILVALATQPIDDLNRADAAYKAGRYQEAYSLYETALTRPDVPQGPVFYNMGNCAFRLNRHAEAVLQFSRAQKRLPRDGAVRFNLALAERALGIERPLYESFSDALRSLADAFTPNEFLVLVSVLQTAGLVGLILFRRQRAARNAMVFLVLIALAGTARSVQIRWFPDTPDGVVLHEEIEVRAQPHADRGVIFDMKAGETLRVEESSDRWVRVTHTRGRGWTERDGVGLAD